MPNVNRTVFLVDGFNLYHSLIEASSALAQSTKWLDLSALCNSYLSVMNPGASLENVYYFSALRTHMDSKRPGTTKRHRDYIDCLLAQGVKIELGRFKYKTAYCRKCRQNNPHYEEKETDVAISTKLLELFVTDKADTVVLVTGDTDLAPAVRTAQHLFPSKSVAFGFPFKRQNAELEKLVTIHFKIRSKVYVRYQLPNPVILSSGRKVNKPGHW